MNEYVNFDSLLGKTLTSAKHDLSNYDQDTIRFVDTDGYEYVMNHSQDCCESVTIEDICGNLEDLVGSPIVQAEEVVSGDWPEDVSKENRYDGDSYTWTFYRIATNKGSVVIRWFGTSNGYYSESVSFYRQLALHEAGNA
jgi:hypothetical protein